MLRRLTVRNYAIIRELDMEFGEGFTIITGETGAGKSILLGALGLVLGERADTSVLLSQDEKCVVEACFNISGYDLNELFEANEIDYDDEAILRREITPSGKSRSFLNDTPVNLTVLKDLGGRLIDVHSQHETLLLGSGFFQRRVVDAYAGTSGPAKEYSGAWNRYLAVRRDYDTAALNLEKVKADFDYYSHQLDEFRAVKPVQGEQEVLEKEQEMLSNASEIKEALSAVAAAMGGDDVSALSLLRSARTGLSRIAGWLPEAAELEKRLETQLIELNDISYEVEKLNDRASADPGRLEYVTQRLDSLYSLMQKHRCRDIEELLAVQQSVEEAVAASSDTDEKLGELKKRRDAALAGINALSSKLSAARKKAAAPLSAEITGMLHRLGMPHARFEVAISPLPSPGPSGTDDIGFLFSANRQVEPEDLSKCASGGELSRVMLCLKSVLANSSGLPAIIFDEIDSGVSGEVASMVGSILSEMGKSMQVINITHLPQVAARGRIHYHVYKEESDHSTITRVRLLKDDERVKEVARLLSGSTVTEAAMRNARELMKDN
ncbi:MAG: DNA repair protein RecN [Bacteroidota bacterium]|jgi:DNA repair protein RecN (Recombination protein N)|nr:DNA repair protein RecN [Bacteroidota bacterium]